MASSKDYLIYVLDLLREVDGISYKKMMGEFIIYKNNLIIGGIYDNRFLIKNTPSMISKKMKEEIPYPHAKKMLLVDVEDADEIKEIVDLLYDDLLSSP